MAEMTKDRQALVSLRNEVAGLLGAFRFELVEAISLTNVRALEAKLVEADAALAVPHGCGDPKPAQPTEREAQRRG